MRSSPATIARSSPSVPSELPSSTTTSSHGTPTVSSASRTARTELAIWEASLYAGIPTVNRGRDERSPPVKPDCTLRSPSIEKRAFAVTVASRGKNVTSGLGYRTTPERLDQDECCSDRWVVQVCGRFGTLLTK